METGKKISNVVEENDKLKTEINSLLWEVQRLRKQLLLFGTIKIPEEDEDSEEEGKGRRSIKKNAPSYDNN